MSPKMGVFPHKWVDTERLLVSFISNHGSRIYKGCIILKQKLYVECSLNKVIYVCNCSAISRLACFHLNQVTHRDCIIIDKRCVQRYSTNGLSLLYGTLGKCCSLISLVLTLICILSYFSFRMLSVKIQLQKC